MILVMLALTGCASAPSASWRLEAMNGGPVTMNVTSDLVQRGRIAGQGPYNRYFGDRSGIAPAYAVSALGATEMACPELPLEADYFAVLHTATQQRAAEGRLVLTGQVGELVFNRR